MKNFILAFIAVFFALTSYGNVIEDDLTSIKRMGTSIIVNDNSINRVINNNEVFLIKEENKLVECTMSKTMDSCDDDGNCTSYTYEATAENCRDARRMLNEAIAADGWVQI